MSMTTLGAQLAALNGSSVGGSVLPTSRRHEDAIGRGIHHSVQVGHGLANKSHIYKASILYETAREASNVPLVTLQENCIKALEELVDIDPYFQTILSSSMIQKKNIERGLMTRQENEDLDENIQHLLFRLGTHMTDTNLVPSALNVIEYLMRGLDLHLRPKLISTVLLVWLPHHENAYFLRWIQLVDLVSVGTTYSWLRPYSIPNGRIGREIIAKAASTNLALFRDILQLAKKAAYLPKGDRTMAFTAAVLVEAICLQHRTTGTMEERTGQALLPMIRQACQVAHKNRSWANWGYIMASTVVETSCLADTPRKGLVSSILQGITKTNTKTPSDNSTQEANHEDEDDDDDVEMTDDGKKPESVDRESVQNALVVVLSLLQQQPPMESYQRDIMEQGDNEEEHGFFQLSVGSDKEIMYYGYNRNNVMHSKIVSKAMLSMDGLPDRLGELLVDDGFVDVVHIVASLWIIGWKQMEKIRSKATTTTTTMDDDDDPSMEGFLLGLLKNEKLFQYLWSKPEWIEALTFFTLSNAWIHTKDNASHLGSHSLLDIVLKILRQHSPLAYEQGVARSLLRLKRKARSELANYLGFSPATATTSKVAGNGGKCDVLLPPRVALNDIDIEIRLDAIDRLVGQEEDDHDIAMILLQRVFVEEELEVASKATKTLCSLTEKKSKTKKSFDHRQVLETEAFARTVVESLYKWSERSTGSSSSDHTCRLILLTAMSASKLMESQGISELFVQLLEGILAFLMHENTSIGKQSASGIIMVLTSTSSKTKGTSKASDIDAFAALTSQGDEILRQLGRSDDESMDVMQEVMRRRSILPVLKAFSVVPIDRISQITTEYSPPSLEYCLWVLKVHGKSLSEDERNQLLVVLNKATSQGFETPNLLYPLLSTMLAYGGVLFDDVVNPFIVNVCSKIKQKNGEHASSVAVLMELALRPETNGDAIKKLLVISNGLASDENELCHFGLTYSLSLLSHTELSVRRAAISLISKIGENLVRNHSPEIKELAKICSYVTENESSAVMGSHSFLMSCLRDVTTSSKGSGVVQTLLRLVLCTILADTSSKSMVNASKLQKNSGFLEFENVRGGHVAAIALMGAAQSTGEGACPLATRWSQVAMPVIHILLEADATAGIPSTTQALLEHLVTMLKGMKTTNATEHDSNVIIMSGPGGRGGRRRSYSFGKGEIPSFLLPYPKDMSATLVSLITSRSSSDVVKHVRHVVCAEVLSSVSWGENVFLKISKSVRQQLASALLGLMIENLTASMESAFLALPLGCDDVAKLLREQRGLASITYLADFTHANSTRLASSDGLAEMIEAFFDIFTELSSGSSVADEGIDFTRKSVLDALTDLLERRSANPEVSRLELFHLKKFGTWMEVLVGVINPREGSPYRPLETSRSKQSTLSVLTVLCTLYPEVLIDKLIPAISSIASAVTAEKDAVVVSELLCSVVPVYLGLASKASLTALELIEAFIAACGDISEDATRIRLYQGFVDAVSGYEKTGEGDLLGCFVSACLARDLWISRRSDAPTSSALMVQQMVSQISATKRVHVTLTVVSYAREVLSLLGGEEAGETTKTVPLQNLLSLAGSDATGKRTKAKPHISDDDAKEKLSHALMGASCEMISSSVFARYLRHSNMESSESVVRLWQDLLLIQSICNSQLGGSEGGKISFWSLILDFANETLESIQKHLPSPIFLAFATSLVRESDSEELRARALQLVSDRALQLDPMDTESYLFMDMMPFLTALVEKEEGMMVRTAALVAVEHITRKMCVESVGLGTKYADAVAKALMVTGALFESQCRRLKLTASTVLDSAAVQLLCTASLCAATAIRTCGARALPSLPKMLRPSLKLFGDINSALATSGDDDTSYITQLRMLQLSSLRLISAATETIPQFLTPYLEELFQPTVLSSPSLQQNDSDSSGAVSAAAIRLRETIAVKIPTRQLLNPLTQAIVTTRTHAEVNTLMNLLTMSINYAKSSELVGKTTSILKAGTFVYDMALKEESPGDLVLLATDMFTTLVLKLSELQLRSFYETLRSWCGSFDAKNTTEGAFRRYCFWFFSSALAAQIKSIYLPCLTTVFSDAVNELDAAVTALTSRSKTSGSKKQRLEGIESNSYDAPTLLSLQAMMKCLEVSLRSDAHEGGSWLQDGESERFDLLMTPLGKLLSCRIKDHGPGAPSFRELVQVQKENRGCVVDAIVALALAAGDEQKWKPLNHMVLEACSHETRPEVRKAGITCLLSLIQSIGEEYMVLIPECLPVLSELLEDADEEIAGLTQECISMSEELLGESLEDSLR